MIIIEAYFDNRSFYRLGVVNIFREEKKLSSFLHHFPISTHTGKLDRHEASDSFRTWRGGGHIVQNANFRQIFLESE